MRGELSPEGKVVYGFLIVWNALGILVLLAAKACEVVR